MAQSEFPHFGHHVREMHRTRRRFRLTLLTLVASLLVLITVQFQARSAPVAQILSGRAYDTSTGAGIAGVKVALCGAGAYAVTNGAGNWTLLSPEASQSCVHYSGGGASVSGEPMAVRTAMGYDFGFKTKPTPAKPAIVKLASPRGTVAAAETIAPSVPANFQSTVSADNALVELSWSPSTDASGIKAYVLDRSLDQQTWETVAENIQTTTYSDKSAGFGVHYFYRLKALDAAGNASGYATSDVNTSDYSTNSSTTDPVTYTSDDNNVAVLVPAGAVVSEADCSVSTVNIPNGKDPAASKQKLVEGPYSLVCKTLAGDSIQTFQKPVTWTFILKNKLKGLINPQPYSWDGDKSTPIKDSKFDSSQEALQFAASTTGSALVLADVPPGVPVNAVAVFFLLALVVAGVAVLILRKKQRHTYDNYLRKKYYNL